MRNELARDLRWPCPSPLVTLSRLNGTTVAINPDLITWIDVAPDTIVSLLGGDKIIVREPLQEVIDRIVEFRRIVGSPHTGIPHSGVKEGALSHLDLHRREARHSSIVPSGRISLTPLTPPTRTPPDGT